MARDDYPLLLLRHTAIDQLLPVSKEGAVLENPNTEP